MVCAVCVEFDATKLDAAQVKRLACQKTKHRNGLASLRVPDTLMNRQGRKWFCLFAF